jgi:hypothetical protein
MISDLLIIRCGIFANTNDFSENSCERIVKATDMVSLARPDKPKRISRAFVYDILFFAVDVGALYTNPPS